MLNNISLQYKSGKAMAQGRYYALFRAQTTPMARELYPFANDYYHELNPFFLFNIVRPYLMNFCRTFTVRDGKIPFSVFMVKNIRILDALNCTFIIHPDLAKFVPKTHREKFCSWAISHTPSCTLKTAKSLLVSGIMNEKYLEPKTTLRKKLEQLKLLPPNVPVEFYLPVRKSVFDVEWKENFTGYEIVSLIKDVLPRHKVTFISTNELMERPSFSGTYLLDIFKSDQVVMDKYLGHFITARGGTVGEWPTHAPEDSFFELNLSFNHKLHISPLPDVPSIFSEIIFYRKLNPLADLYNDSVFYKMISEEE